MKEITAFIVRHCIWRMGDLCSKFLMVFSKAFLKARLGNGGHRVHDQLTHNLLTG